MAALGASAALALVGVDGVRERIEVTALPLRASVAQVWSSAVRAFPSAAPATPAQARAALAHWAPSREELAEESTALDRGADEPEAQMPEPAVMAALPLEIGALREDDAADGDATDGDDAPEDSEPAFEARPMPRDPVTARVVASAAQEPPKAHEPSPAHEPLKAEPVTATALEMRRAVAQVLAEERHAKPAARGAAPRPVAREHSASELAGKPAKAAPVARASRPPASETKPAKQSPRSDPQLERALADAEGLIGRHNLDALEAYRRLGRAHPREARVLEGWSRVAASNKWWGESLKVAERWAALDASPAAQLHLARTQKRLGQVDKAIGTLKTLLAKRPSDREATSLLQAYGGTSVALR
jgi:hypothetical protein